MAGIDVYRLNGDKPVDNSVHKTSISMIAGQRVKIAQIFTS
jgi:hypothetical protein